MLTKYESIEKNTYTYQEIYECLEDDNEMKEKVSDWKNISPSEKYEWDKYYAGVIQNYIESMQTDFEYLHNQTTSRLLTYSNDCKSRLEELSKIYPEYII